MSKSNFGPENFVFTPPQVAYKAKQHIEFIEKNKHRTVPFPISGIDSYIAPLLPGEIFAVIAQTHNNKSGFLHFWEMFLAQHFMKTGRSDEIIIHVATEESIEDQANIFLASESGLDAGDLSRGIILDRSALDRAIIKIGTVPVYRIGVSLFDGTSFQFCLSNIFKAIDHIVNGNLLGRKLKVGCIFIDYLQELEIDPAIKNESFRYQRRLQVESDVRRSRDMARYFFCPVVVAVQGKQVLGGAAGPNMLVPGIYDGQETSAIATKFDRIWTQWMVKTTHRPGEILTHGDLAFTSDENLMFGKCGKQRGRLPSGRIWPLRTDFRTNNFVMVKDPNHDPFKVVSSQHTSTQNGVTVLEQ